MFFITAEHGEEVDDQIHQLHISASPSVVGILEDVGEEGHERGDRKIDDEPMFNDQSVYAD
jgi:hypothetical protein